VILVVPENDYYPKKMQNNSFKDDLEFGEDIDEDLENDRQGIFVLHSKWDKCRLTFPVGLFFLLSYFCFNGRISYMGN
jgi:hypothetical protein